MFREISKTIQSVIQYYSEIFFLHGAISGLLILGVTFLNPYSAIAGILSVSVAYLFARFIGYRQVFVGNAFYVYNALLIGFSIGSTFKLNEITLLLIVSAGILSFVLSAVLAQVFSTYFKLPVLSLPFVIVSSIIYLAAGRYTNLFVLGLHGKAMGYDNVLVPAWIMAFFKSLGGIVFVPDPVAGAIIAVVLLLSSRILFLLAVSGFLLGGTIQGLYVGSFQNAITDPNSFNYILIAMGLGGVFLIPSIQSYVIAMVGVMISTLLIGAVNVFWAQLGIPVFTLPFVLVTLMVVYVLGLIQYRFITRVFKDSPEKIVDHYLTTRQRFGDDLVLSLPFFGTWTVWQGFDGKWTHQGAWRYGYDFVQTEQGRTYAQDGLWLSHYFAYRQAVLSPVQGRVVWVIRHLPDNPIGTVDTVNNWGNLVMIYDPRGVYVTLAHFAENSIVVNEGDWVVPGTYLGECGNSGYSPQPHLHLQVQWAMPMTSATLPFCFHRYTDEGMSFTNALPSEGKTISHYPVDPTWDQLTNFALDDVLNFEVIKKGSVVGHWSFRIAMSVDATFYMESATAKLYFGKVGGIWFSYSMEGNDPYLRMIYLALPKCPLSAQGVVSWTDAIPQGLSMSGLPRAIASILDVVVPGRFKSTGHYYFYSTSEVRGDITHPLFGKLQSTSIVLDGMHQVMRVRCGHWELKRQVSNKESSCNEI